MTEQQRQKALDVVSRKIAGMYPADRKASVTFDIADGKCKGIREDFKRRPAPPIPGGY